MFKQGSYIDSIRRVAMERYHYSDEQRSFLENNPVPFAIYQFMNKRVVTLILSDHYYLKTL